MKKYLLLFLMAMLVALPLFSTAQGPVLKIRLFDTDQSHYTTFIWNEAEASANRTLNWVMNGGDRTFDISGNFTLDGANSAAAWTISARAGLTIRGSVPFDDEPSGTLKLQNVDSLDATTEGTIESAIDTLANLTSIQGHTFTLAGNFVTQNNNVTINAVTAARTFTMNENFIVGDGSDVTITAEDAAGAVTLDNINFEVEDTVGSGNTIKIVNATSDASRTITLSEDLTIADGQNVTLHGSGGEVAQLAIDTQNAERTLDMSANLTVTGASTINQNVSTTGDPTFDDLVVDKLEANECFTYDAVQTATGDGDTTIAWGSGNIMYFTFGAANEIIRFTAPPGVAKVTMIIKQDGVGSRTIDWSNIANILWPGNVEPTLSTGAADVDIIVWIYDGTSWFGLFNGDFS